MRLLQLSLQNFKGIERFDLVTEGKDVRISGKNAAGKTTLYDAYLWLLFGRDSQNSANFEVKTLDDNGEPIHNLEHKVTAEIEVRGQHMTLSRTYREKWVRKRGQAQREFAGHETDYQVDDVPMGKGEYERRVSQIIDEDLFRLLSNPMHFMTLHWQERRRLLMGLVEVGDSEVVESNPDLADLAEALGNRSMDDAKRAFEGIRRDLRRQIDAMPGRIGEAQRLARTDLDVEALKKRLAELEKKQAKAQAAVEKASKAEAEAHRAYVEGNEASNKHARLVSEVRSELVDAEHALALAQRDVDAATREIERLRAEYKEQRHQAVCPTCGQSIKEDFQESRLERLKQLGEETKKVQKAATSLVKARTKDVEKAKARLDRAVADAPPRNDDLYKRYEKARTAVANAEASTFDLAIRQAERELADAQRAAEAQERVKELLKEESDLTRRYEDNERKLWLISEFYRTQARLTEERINALFLHARFRLFTTQINGEIQDACITTLEGIPYDNLNSGARINVGLDIINTLSKHLDFAPPVWVDNAESVLNLVQADGQMLTLYVEPHDLKAEVL